MNAFFQGLFAIFFVIATFFILCFFFLFFRGENAFNLMDSLYSSIFVLNSAIMLISMGSCAIAAFFLLQVRSIEGLYRFAGGAIAAVAFAALYYGTDSVAFQNLLDGLLNLRETALTLLADLGFLPPVL